MELPSILSNRDAYRRSLQSSLHDVLGDVTLDTQQMGMGPVGGGTAPPVSQRQQLQQPALSGFSAFESSLLRGGGPPTSLLAQSLGTCPSNFTQSGAFVGFGTAQSRPDDLMLAKVTASASGNHHLLNQAAKAAFLQQTLTAQHNSKALGEAYIQLLREKVKGQNPAPAPQQQQAPSVPVNSNIPPSLLYASLALPHPQHPQQQPQQQQAIVRKDDSSAEKKQKIAQTLKALGTNLRSRYDPFIDCLDIEDPEEDATRRSRGGVSEHFPERLHRMLLDIEKDGNSDVISFYSHGRAFGVHDMDRFVNEVMPKYFKQSKWNSFARQLNLYGFMRLASGPDSGGYYHELFIRSRPSLSRYMRRVGVPQGQQDRRKCRPKNVVDIQEPDFYSMKPGY